MRFLYYITALLKKWGSNIGISFCNFSTVHKRKILYLILFLNFCELRKFENILKHFLCRIILRLYLLHSFPNLPLLQFYNLKYNFPHLQFLFLIQLQFNRLYVKLFFVHFVYKKVFTLLTCFIST